MLKLILSVSFYCSLWLLENFKLYMWPALYFYWIALFYPDRLWAKNKGPYDWNRFQACPWANFQLKLTFWRGGVDLAFVIHPLTPKEPPEIPPFKSHHFELIGTFKM